MKTEVIMKRILFGNEISQKSKSEMFSATDLIKAGNKWRLSQGLYPFDLTEWLRQKNTKEFILSLEKKFGTVKISGRGRGSHTWVHPYLFIDLALAISPELKIEAYEWLYDNLLKFRNNSGDSYKKMTGSLWELCTNKREFPDLIKKVAIKIQKECNVLDWEHANENQLILRDKIHDNISLLSNVLRDVDSAVRIGINEAKK